MLLLLPALLPLLLPCLPYVGCSCSSRCCQPVLLWRMGQAGVAVSTSNTALQQQQGHEERVAPML
jgi:hypothetical protein